MAKQKRALLVDILSPWVTGLVARYGHPVYLVGSALKCADDIDAIWKLRDVDVVVVLPDDEFFARFGGDWPYTDGDLEPGCRWAAECGKMSRQACRHFRNLNIDFKVQSESWVAARHHGKPRERIDRVELGLTEESIAAALNRSQAGANELLGQANKQRGNS